MEWIILIALVVGIALFLIKGKATALQHDHYEQQDTLFTAAERSFYGVLCQATKGRALVFGKVRVADVLKTKKGLNPSERQKAFNKISAKHFDYVLCQPEDLSVFAAVELDDSSHNSKKRIARDKFLEDACQSAELELHRFKAKRTYNIAELRENIFTSPNTDSLASSLEQKSESEPETLTPLCPKCSSEMVRKVAKKGQYKGSEFLACSAFPKCRYMVKQNA